MDEGPLEVLPCQLPPKELSLGSFTLPCTIGSLNLYTMADLGASVNIMQRLMFNNLKLTNLKETNMLVEMADMTKKAPMDMIGKKGYILNDIWEKCKHVHGGAMYSRHDEGFEEEERCESGLDEKYYDLPQAKGKWVKVHRNGLKENGHGWKCPNGDGGPA
ncbi:phospholipase-like protein [Tanacetum coccineum]|uniref:Phospholipase-like protein n=1 Tax=Tanacetum coccineum TaxID=301880 RepID=A0ABQ4YQC9_9ASTR